jgi:hypothetical protein
MDSWSLLVIAVMREFRILLIPQIGQPVCCLFVFSAQIACPGFGLAAPKRDASRTLDMAPAHCRYLHG